MDIWWNSTDCIGVLLGCVPSNCLFKDLFGMIKAFELLNDIGGLIVGLTTNHCTRLEKNWGQKPTVLEVLVIWMFHIYYLGLYDRL